MTQYDAIGSSYSLLDELPIKAVDAHNYRLALEPLLRPGIRVIEFACGTGFCTSRLVSWGAASVTAVDVSPVMLSVAADGLAALVSSGQVRLVLGDGTKPQSYAPDGHADPYFDLAFGAWFLNYAKTKAELVAMFTSIALNLKPGGVFVGVVPPPCNEYDMAQRARELARPPLSQLRPRLEYLRPLDSGDGWQLRLSLDDALGFVGYHLTKQVYEEAAALAGLVQLEWRSELIPQGCGGMSDDEWRARKGGPPHMGILVVRKSAK